MRATYKDDSVKGQVTCVGELLANGAVSQELVLDGKCLDSSVQVLNRLSETHHYKVSGLKRGKCVVSWMKS